MPVIKAMFIVFLDTKVFDRVEYCKLFTLLLKRDMPPHIIRVLTQLNSIY